MKDRDHESHQSEHMSESNHQSWLALIGLGVATGIGGGLFGTVVGTIPGFILFRNSGGGPFDAFVTLVTFFAVGGAVVSSCLLCCTVFKAGRLKCVVMTGLSCSLPTVGWFALAVLADGPGFYRIGGWALGVVPWLLLFLFPILMPKPQRR